MQSTATLTPVAARVGAGVVRMDGDDALRYLEDVTSQSFVGFATGDVRGTMVLDANGGPVAIFDVIGRDDHLLLVAPSTEVEQHALITMKGRTFLLEATFAPTELAVIAFRGASPAPNAGTVAMIERPHGVDVVTSDAESLLADAPAADPATIERDLADWDIAHGVPRWGHEIVPPHMPEELGLLPTHVHLKKGCYPGQEAIARMWNLGRPRRRLARLEFTGSVAEGAEVGSGQNRITITGVVSSDPSVGMGFVGRDAIVGQVATAPRGTVRIGGLVGVGVPQPGHDPGVKRRRDTR